MTQGEVKWFQSTQGILLWYPAQHTTCPVPLGGEKKKKKSNIEHRDDSVYKWFFVGGSVIPEGWKEKKKIIKEK